MLTTGHGQRRGVDFAGAGTETKRLGELLLEAGVVNALQLEAALAYQRETGGKLGQVLVRLGFATEAKVVEALRLRGLSEEAVGDVSPAITRGAAAARPRVGPVAPRRPMALELERSGDGRRSTPESTRVLAALMRVLVSKGLVSELELVRELDSVLRGVSAG